MEIIELVQWIVAVGAGSVVTVLTQVLFIKPNRKIKYAEAQSAEFDALKKQIDYANERIDKILIELGQTEAKKRQVQLELEASETKRYKLKNCISRAHGCTNRDCCPVLCRQRELELEWIEQQKRQ